MNLMKCDICGKMMTWDEWMDQETSSIIFRRPNASGAERYSDDTDFCEECTKKLTAWLKGAKDEG